MEMSPRPAAASADWWRQAVVYQVYPRSFADSGGDGLGDLRGIISRVPYLASLGIDAVWLSPFYPSALADGGYDVDDYRNVDPQLGTLADFDELTALLHARGIKVIVDIVPNHTSSRHAWFREALAAPMGSPARNRYIFRDGLGPDGSQPPSDWVSVFGGPAWARVPDGQWYLHLFAAEQPDLNWDNREVRDDFLKTLRFWSDRGVDGFRVDVAHGLAKNLAEPLERLDGQASLVSLLDGTHPLWDRDEVHGIYAEWRQVFNEYDPPRAGVAEAWVPPSRRARYASPHGLGQAFNFDLLEANWNAGELLRVITDNLAAAQQYGTSTTWVLSNHDVVRHASRYGLQARSGLPQQHAERQDMAVQQRHLTRAQSQPRPASRSRGHPADAGAARVGLPVPGGGTRPARGRGPSPRCPPGSRLPAVRRRGKGPRRVPGPAALDDRRPVVRVQRRRRAPATADLVWPAQRRGAGAGLRVHPGPVPAGAQLAPPAPGRRKPGMDARHRRAGAALPPSRRLAIRDQLRARARSAAGRNRGRRQLPPARRPAARRHHRLARPPRLDQPTVRSSMTTAREIPKWHR